ncbi:MAG: gliding motility protein GldL [Flavobacterium sp.]|nr:gliding motility protein GldL [Flavobacterium sp.]
MKYKHLIILFLIALLGDIFGAFFKIIHLEFADSLLLITTSIQAIAILLLIVKLTSDDKTDFLNR